MYETNHKTVFLLDHSSPLRRLCCAPTSQSNKRLYRKPLWTAVSEATQEYCRIVWDIFPTEKKITFIVSDTKSQVLSSWLAFHQTINFLTPCMNEFSLPRLPNDPNAKGESFVHGIKDAINVLSELTPSQIESCQDLLSRKSADHFSNSGRIICITTSLGNDDVEHVNEVVYTLIKQQNEATQKNTSQDARFMKLNYCHLVIINVFPVTDANRVKYQPKRRVSPILSIEVHSVVITQLNNTLSSLVGTHFDLASAKILGMPVKDEKTGGIVEREVRIYYPSLVYSIGTETTSTPRARRRDKVSLKWIYASKQIPVADRPIHRVSPAFINSFEVKCLLDILTDGKCIILELHNKTHNTITIHILTMRLNEIYIRKLPAIPPMPVDALTTPTALQVDKRTTNKIVNKPTVFRKTTEKKTTVNLSKENNKSSVVKSYTNKSTEYYKGSDNNMHAYVASVILSAEYTGPANVSNANRSSDKVPVGEKPKDNKTPALVKANSKESTSAVKTYAIGKATENIPSDGRMSQGNQSNIKKRPSLLPRPTYKIPTKIPKTTNNRPLADITYNENMCNTVKLYGNISNVNLSPNDPGSAKVSRANNSRAYENRAAVVNPNDNVSIASRPKNPRTYGNRAPKNFMPAISANASRPNDPNRVYANKPTNFMPIMNQAAICANVSRPFEPWPPSANTNQAAIGILPPVPPLRMLDKRPVITKINEKRVTTVTKSNDNVAAPDIVDVQPGTEINAAYSIHPPPQPIEVNWLEYTDPLPTILSKKVLIASELFKCRKIIYTLLAKEANKIGTPFETMIVGPNQALFKCIWRNLECFLKNNLHSEDHFIIYRTLLTSGKIKSPIKEEKLKRIKATWEKPKPELFVSPETTEELDVDNFLRKFDWDQDTEQEEPTAPTSRWQYTKIDDVRKVQLNFYVERKPRGIHALSPCPASPSRSISESTEQQHYKSLLDIYLENQPRGNYRQLPGRKLNTKLYPQLNFEEKKEDVVVPRSTDSPMSPPFIYMGEYEYR